MNILQFICPTGFYGAERWVLALANNISSEINCDLAITLEPHQDSHEIIEQYPDTAGKTHAIRTKGAFDLSAISQLSQVIIDNDIQIIHTHGYKSDIIGYLAAKKAGIKCVSTPHGFGESINLKLKLYIKLGVFFLRFFDAVSPLSQQLVDEVKEQGVPDKKITYIQNSVDLKEVEAFHKNQEDTPNKKFIIGYIGQLIARKQIHHLIEVFDKAHAQHPEIELQILGDGFLRQELEAYANTLPSKDAIHFLGFRNDRLELLCQQSVFAMTSTSEGIPRCMMEAMGMEISILAYDIPGIDQLVTNNETGLLAPLGDKEQLQEQLIRLITDSSLREKLAASGRKFIQDHYSAKRMATEYESLFHKLLNTSESSTDTRI